MSATTNPVQSPATNAASQVSGPNKGLPGWGKIAVAGCAVAGMAVWFGAPGLFGGAKPHGLVQTTADDTPASIPFTPPPRTAAPPAAPPVAGQAPASHVRRLPPPLELGTVYVQPQPVQTAPPSRVGIQTGAQVAAGAYGAGITPVYIPEAGAPGGPNAAPALPGSLSEQLEGASGVHVVQAGIMAHPDFTISAGTRIPCLSQDAINSTLGGYHSCIVTEWVRGTTVARGILPPGTRIFGQIRKGLVNGQDRLAIVFTRIETSGDHFIANIADPAADAMGRAGVDGNLDTHFWKNAGAVALYALIEGLQGAVTNGATAAINGAVRGSNSLGFFSFGGSGQSLASAALQGRMNNPPTLERPEGFPLEVTVGEDLDFYGACVRRMQVNPMACPVQ